MLWNKQFYQSPYVLIPYETVKHCLLNMLSTFEGLLRALQPEDILIPDSSAVLRRLRILIRWFRNILSS